MLSLFSNQKFKFTIGSLCVAVVFLWAVVTGSSAGQATAQAQIIAGTGKEVFNALQYFYSDQNRYPSAVEFSDQTVMLNYLTNFPLPDLPSANCSESFVYKRADNNNFSLNFCLPRAFGAYSAGWNTVAGTPSAAWQ